MKWIKASERLPIPSGKRVCVRYRDKYYEGFRNFNSAYPSIVIELPSGTIAGIDCEWLDESPQPFPGIEERAKELWPLVDRRDIYAGDRFKAIQLATEATEQLRGEAAKWNEIAGQNARDCLSLQQQLTQARERIKELEDAAKSARDNLEAPCSNCEYGQYQAVGLTQPNGQQKYECDRCSHEVSFP